MVALLKQPAVIDRDDATREYCRRSLANFVRKAWHIVEPGSEYVHGLPIDAICEHLEAISRGELTHVMISVPPGTMKSLLTQVFWFAWEWGPLGMQHKRHIGVSNNTKLSIPFNVKARRLISSPWFQRLWPEVTLYDDQNEKTRFENPLAGFREAMAITSLTGSRAHRLLVDDPHTVWTAMSDVKREAEVNGFFASATDRLTDMNKDAIVVIMQRLHRRDLIGQIIEKGLDYVHLNLPMEFVPKTRCVTKWFTDPREEKGELLFPERFNRAVVDRVRKEKAHFFNAQYQQNPTGSSASLNREDWLGTYEKLPTLLSDIVIRVDTAPTSRDTSDNSAMFASGMDQRYGNKLYALDAHYGKWGFLELCDEIVKFALKFIEKQTQTLHVLRIDVEDANVGPGVVSYVDMTLHEKLKNTPWAIEVNCAPKIENKFKRATKAVPYFQKGQLLLPTEPTDFSDLQWIPAFKHEFDNFSLADTHDIDDIFDCVVYRVLEEFHWVDGWSGL